MRKSPVGWLADRAGRAIPPGRRGRTSANSDWAAASSRYNRPAARFGQQTLAEGKCAEAGDAVEDPGADPGQSGEQRQDQHSGVCQEYRTADAPSRLRKFVNENSMQIANNGSSTADSFRADAEQRTNNEADSEHGAPPPAM